MNVPKGRDRAISIGLLAESYGQSRRAVERELEEAVKSGVPIIACERGVYIATSKAEIEEYCESLHGRIEAVAARIRALRRAAELMNGEQEVLPWAA